MISVPYTLRRMGNGYHITFAARQIYHAAKPYIISRMRYIADTVVERENSPGGQFLGEGRIPWGAAPSVRCSRLCYGGKSVCAAQHGANLERGVGAGAGGCTIYNVYPSSAE